MTDESKTVSLKKINDITKIIISRVDNIGDVVLTLPLAGLLKQYYPNSEITFLARHYVKDLVNQCQSVDRFMDWEALKTLADESLIAHFDVDVIIHALPHRRIATIAKRAGIPIRIGSNRRFYHWYTCNYFANFSRKRSHLHEAQLNLKLLKPLGFTPQLNHAELTSLIKLSLAKTSTRILNFIDPQRFTLIIHPGTNGHTREWPADYFLELINRLPTKSIQVILTGSKTERKKFSHWLTSSPHKIDNVMGELSLLELMQLIKHSDALLANSTGPLHLAGVLGTAAIGLYPACQGLNPERWAPLGQHVYCIVGDTKCQNCGKPGQATCMQSISISRVHDLIFQLTRSSQ
jgi:lipopolysaccharide heptosyltransferase III